jgi:prepilin-type N-terminal cleavage/methylation domain-containing protein
MRGGFGMGFRYPSLLFRRKWRETFGFTIIELLVVIVIVGILAAAGASKYQGIVEDARKNSCVANLNQINNAVSIWCAQSKPLNETSWGAFYFDNFGGKYSSASIPFTGSEIADTIRDSRVWVCPKMMQRRGYTSLSQVALLDNVYCNSATSTTLLFGCYLFISVPPGCSSSPDPGHQLYYVQDDTLRGVQLVLCLDSGCLTMPYRGGITCPNDMPVKYRHCQW